MIEKTIYENQSANQAMKDYGYTWDGMLPLEAKDAVTLIEGGAHVFLLHPDGTEAEVSSIEDVSAHAAKGGLFGVEKNNLTQKEIYVPVEDLDDPVEEKSQGIRATIEANKEKAATKEPVKPSKEHAIGDDR